MWGSGMYPYALMPGDTGHGMNRPERGREEEACRVAERDRRSIEDPHLRSCKEVVGYHLHARGGEIGHVEDFLLDDETWVIRHAINGEIGHIDGFLLDEEIWAICYVIVNTSNSEINHRVLIAPRWITGASWAAQTLTVDMTRESIKATPPHDPILPWGPAQDTSLYRHYGRTDYWAGNTALLPAV